jgi:acyl-CoA thioesterase FadM
MDELLGFAQSMGGQPGMTGTLTIRYRSPTPLHTELRLQARVDGVERRKTLASGEIYAGETLCAEAEGIFVSVGRERFERLVVEREERRVHD